MVDDLPLQVIDFRNRRNDVARSKTDCGVRAVLVALLIIFPLDSIELLVAGRFSSGLYEIGAEIIQGTEKLNGLDTDPRRTERMRD